MSSSCKSVADCIEFHAPIRATYVNLYKWPESDAEFVKSLTTKQTREKEKPPTDYWYDQRKRYGSRPQVVDSYSCRQMYLRSYTFSKKETVPEKTVKCFNRVKDKVQFFNNNNEKFDCSSNSSRNMINCKKKKKKKKKKGCVMVKRVKDVSCDVVLFIFHRLLACAASVDVVDH
ncbi:hypothetical protein LUZ60_004070 [Juncus effusus]|nr:hypothetical protein LUZ60_004070 [Juncus effusus]